MKIRIILKSFEKEIIKSASKQIYNTCILLNQYQVSGIVALPIKIKKYCVLRSPHIDKDSREHFELRIYKHFIDLITDKIDSLDSLLNISLPMGVICTVKILNHNIQDKY